MCSLYVTYIAIICLANIYIISTVPQHPQILATPLVYKFSFFLRKVPNWNDLTTEQVSGMNLEQFKTLIM